MDEKVVVSTFSKGEDFVNSWFILPKSALVQLNWVFYIEFIYFRIKVYFLKSTYPVAVGPNPFMSCFVGRTQDTDISIIGNASYPSVSLSSAGIPTAS